MIINVHINKLRPKYYEATYRINGNIVHESRQERTDGHRGYLSWEVLELIGHDLFEDALEEVGRQATRAEINAAIQPVRRKDPAPEDIQWPL